MKWIKLFLPLVIALIIVPILGYYLGITQFHFFFGLPFGIIAGIIGIKWSKIFN